MPTLQPQTRIGSYELTRLLGEGGMGDVWLAQDLLADRRVALKFIKPHLLADSGFRTRFINEAKTLGKLEHDRIVTLYSVVEADVHLALVLRFIDGKSLAHRIDTQGALPLEFVLSCAHDVLPALQFAHDSGIIHRDIKPENILVDSRDRCFLMDFGIAVATFAERGTMTGLAIGTPHYMSPEQIRTPRQITPETGGHRSDIYSFGVVLYEMLSGRVPFGAQSGVEDIYAIQTAHCTETPQPLRELNPNVPPAVETVVMSCLAKDPAERPQTCGELLAQLETAGKLASHSREYSKTVFEGRPPQPPQPVSPAKAVKPRRKIPQLVWYAAGVLCIAGGIGFTVMNSSSSKPPISNAGTSNQITQKRTDSAGTGDFQKARNNSVLPNHPVPGTHPTVVSATRPQQPVSTPLPTAQTQPNPEALSDYQEGQRLFDQGDYCASESKLNQAVSLDPNPKYLKLQKSAVNGCNATTQ